MSLNQRKSLVGGCRGGQSLWLWSQWGAVSYVLCQKLFCVDDLSRLSQELCTAQPSSSSFGCLWLVPLSVMHGRRPRDLISSLSSSLPPGNRREDVELEGKAQGRVGAAMCCPRLASRPLRSSLGPWSQLWGQICCLFPDNLHWLCVRGKAFAHGDYIRKDALKHQMCVLFLLLLFLGV